MAKTKMNIQYDDRCEYIWSALGIKQIRAEELDYRLNLIIHEIQKPLRKNETMTDSIGFIKLCLALAETEQELAFCAYVAGVGVASIYQVDEEEEYNDDEDWRE